MTTYLIDLENVHAQGLNGLNTLTNKDRIIVFIGKKQTAISTPISLLRLLSKSRIDEPQWVWVQMQHTASSYLDMYLTSYLAVEILNAHNENETYVIVSKDQGYKAVIDFWKKRTRKYLYGFVKA